MSSLSRELVFLILQFLDEEKFKETVHKLEQESGFYFNMKHFEDLVTGGEWDEVERYLSGFTKVEDNRYSMKIFFEIRKQKYLEALDRHDRAKAVEILVKDLKVFASFNEELFKEITQLLTLENFRQNEQLSKYGDTKSARNIMLMELKKLIEANPLFRDKLNFPPFKASRLRTLINQSLNWQHQLCKNPRPNPDIKTLFTDHSCAAPANGARAPPPANGPLVGPIPKSAGFPPMGAHAPFQPVVSPTNAIAGWMTNANPSMPHAAVAQGPPGLVQAPNTAAFLKHPRTPTSGPGIDYQSADSEHLMKRMRVGQPDEPFQPVVSPSLNAIPGWMTNGNSFMPYATVARGHPVRIEAPYTATFTKHPRNTGPSGIDHKYAYSEHLRKQMYVGQPYEVSFSGASHPANMNTQEDLPKVSVCTLNQGSTVMSLAFHPVQQTILVVGTYVGDITIWDFASLKMIAHKRFEVRGITSLTWPLQAALKKHSTIAVNRCLWSPDGTILGVAFSKHIVQTYRFVANGELQQLAEIDAHIGGVNDIAFFQPNETLSMITCGDDKLIKVWNAQTGQKQYTLGGHEVPWYSVFPSFTYYIQVKSNLKGHQEKITGLAFSHQMNVLVSSGADGQLCVWSIDGWEKKKSGYIQPPANHSCTLVGETTVQFHNDQKHLLLVNECQLAIYDGNLECLCSWSPRDALPAPISSAIYSTDGHLIYAVFCDGAMGVFEVESLRLRWRIPPAAYIPSSESCTGHIYPTVVAVHRMDPDQLAIGMSDGTVHVHH